MDKNEIHATKRCSPRLNETLCRMCQLPGTSRTPACRHAHSVTEYGSNSSWYLYTTSTQGAAQFVTLFQVLQSLPPRHLAVQFRRSLF